MLPLQTIPISSWDDQCFKDSSATGLLGLFRTGSQSRPDHHLLSVVNGFALRLISNKVKELKAPSKISVQHPGGSGTNREADRRVLPRIPYGTAK